LTFNVPKPTVPKKHVPKVYVPKLSCTESDVPRLNTVRERVVRLHRLISLLIITTSRKAHVTASYVRVY